MHDLDELKRQWEQAKSRLRQAEYAERDAERRYAKAACAKLRADLDAQGFTEGTKVRLRRKCLVSTVLLAVGPVEWGNYTNEPRLFFYRIKADGTPGKARAAIHFDPFTDTLELVRDGDAGEA